MGHPHPHPLIRFPLKEGGGDGWMDPGAAERVIAMVGALALATSARPAEYRLGPKRPTEQQWITRVMGSAPSCPLGQP